MNNKIKILYLITQSHWGGAQRYVFDLAKNLQNDFDVTVACGQGGLLIEKLQEQNIQAKVLKNLVRNISLIKDLRCFWQLYKFIKKNQFDIVHTNSSKAEILGNMAAKLAGTKKIIFTAHGFVFNEPLSKMKKKFYIGCEKMAARFADQIITVSDYDQQTAVENKICQPQKLITVYNGVETKTEARKLIESEEKGGSFIVGTVANFYPVKGLKFLISAAKKVCEKFPDVKFKIIGDGLLRSHLEQQILDLNLQNKVELTGFKKNIMAEMKNMDIFVMSSLKEGLPYAILEAQSLGLPVIATKVGGIPEIIIDQKNGLLVGAGDAELLTEKIISLINNPQLRQTMSAKAKINVEQKFNIKKMLDKTKQIYGSEKT